MTARDFCYWLQGYLELKHSTDVGLNDDQLDKVKRHLAMVFKAEIDPSFKPEVQDALNHIHPSGLNPNDDVRIRC